MSEPACDDAAERAVLGCVLLSPRALEDVAPMLTAEDFYSPRHRTIWTVVSSLWDAGSPVEPEIVSRELHRRGELARVGGADYLHTLFSVDNLPTAANATHHARALTELTTLRTIAAAGARLEQLAGSGSYSDRTAEVLEAARLQLEAATQSRGATAGMAVADALAPYLDSLEKPLAGVVPTPWPELDDLLLGGLRAGSLTVLAARTSTGKTLLGLNMARAAAKMGTPAEVLSGEMSRDELMARLISDVATVPWSALTQHRLSEADWGRVARWSDRLIDWPLFIHDRLTGMSVADIRAHCRQRARTGLGYLVVDQASMIRAADPRARRTDQYAQISADLKSLAIEMSIPVVLLHQLNRGPGDRSDKRPDGDSDLRDSDAIKHNADNLILAWRQREQHGAITLILDKHRNGPTGEVALCFEGAYARISSPDLYRPYRP